MTDYLALFMGDEPAQSATPEIVPVDAVMTEEEANAAKRRIARTAGKAQAEIEAELYQCNKRKAWLALGLPNFRAFVESIKEELDFDWRTAYRVVQAHEVTENVIAAATNTDGTVQPVGAAVKHWPRDARVELAKLAPDKQLEAAEAIRQEAATREYFGKAEHLKGRVTVALAQQVITSFMDADRQKVGETEYSEPIDANPPIVRLTKTPAGNTPKARREYKPNKWREDKWHEEGTREAPNRAAFCSMEYDPVGMELFVWGIHGGQMYFMRIPTDTLPEELLTDSLEWQKERRSK